MAHASDHHALLMQNLKDAGCDNETIQICLSQFLRNGNDLAGMLRTLSQHKHKLLDTVHACQKEIDCLDYLLFHLEHGKHEGGNLL